MLKLTPGMVHLRLIVANRPICGARGTLLAPQENLSSSIDLGERGHRGAKTMIQMEQPASTGTANRQYNFKTTGFRKKRATLFHRFPFTGDPTSKFLGVASASV